MRWSRARSLTDLGELTAQWLDGTRRHPDHPEPDPETAEIHGALVRLNRSGEVATLSSQPGWGLSSRSTGFGARHGFGW